MDWETSFKIIGQSAEGSGLKGLSKFVAESLTGALLGLNKAVLNDVGEAAAHKPTLNTNIGGTGLKKVPKIVQIPISFKPTSSLSFYNPHTIRQSAFPGIFLLFLSHTFL